MRNNRLLIALATGVALLLAYAWIDGGQEPIREITAPVAVPEGGG